MDLARRRRAARRRRFAAESAPLSLWERARGRAAGPSAGGERFGAVGVRANARVIRDRAMTCRTGLHQPQSPDRLKHDLRSQSRASGLLGRYLPSQPLAKLTAAAWLGNASIVIWAPACTPAGKPPTSCCCQSLIALGEVVTM